MNRNVSHICRKAKIALLQVTDIVGGPGGTRTPNQAVMSAGKHLKPYHKLLISLKTIEEQNSNIRAYVSQCVARLNSSLFLPIPNQNMPLGVC